MTRRDDLFHVHWILANAVAEGLGLSITLLSAVFATQLAWSNPASPGLLIGASAVVSVGSLFEGGLAGYAQARVLGARWPGLRQRLWIAATALGACVAWVLGLLAVVLTDDRLGSWADPNDATALPMLAAAAIGGVVAGTVRAIPQWLALRPFVKGAWRWIPANGAAWWIGTTVVIAGLDRLAWTGGLEGVLDGLFFVCAAAGAAAGAVHGWALRALPSGAAGTDDSTISRASPVDRRALHG